MKRILPILFIPVLVSACAPGVDVQPALQDFDSYAADLRVVATDPDALKVLAAGEEKRKQAGALVDQGKKNEALPLAEAALADARLAQEVEHFKQSGQRADACRLQVETARTKWSEAVFVLEQTEEFTGSRASFAKRAPVLTEEDEPEPESTLLADSLTIPDMHEVTAQWNAWQKEANDRGVAAADIEAIYRKSYNLATMDKVDAAQADHQRYLAWRAVQMLECRVRTTMNDHVCVQASETIATYSDARAEALHATLDLERNLQDDLKRDLDHLRAEAKTRQDELYNALSQMEGKFASIRRDARGTIVSLADILFDFNKDTLRREVEFNLVKIATILNQFGEMKVLIEGHTDSIGTEEYNLDLSRRRAKAVFDFLVSQGVTEGRLSYDGYGEGRPVADNDTPEGRQKNRRVDLVIQDAPAAATTQ